MQEALSAHIVILNYNGEAILPECLPSIVEAVRTAKTPTTITVLDNLSQDGSEAYIRSHFPEVAFVKAPQNLVLCSYNAFLKTITEPIAILLNNDIRVDSNFIDPLVARFAEDPDTFLVAPRIMSFDGARVESGATRAGFKYGLFWTDARYPGYEAHTMIPSSTFSSGFGAVSTEKFLKLNGYDPLYLPGICEDSDLSLRAVRKGFHLYYEPQSLVYHMGQASFKKAFTDLKRETIAYRNTFFFMWKNFSGLRFWVYHVAFLPWRLLYALGKGRLGFLIGLLEAIWEYPKRRKTA